MNSASPAGPRHLRAPDASRRAAEVMRTVAAWCTAEQSAQVVAGIMRDYEVYRVSVIDPQTDRLLGTISQRELCLRVVAAGLDPKAVTAGEIMQTQPAQCRPEADLASVAKLMLRERAHQLPVVDAENRLLGTIFLADLFVHE